MEELITDEEKGFIGLIRLNKALSRKEIVKRWALGRLHIKFGWQSKHNLWGRFGGGWNWELGFQAGGKTVVLNLLVFSLTFNWEKKDPKRRGGKDV